MLKEFIALSGYLLKCSEWYYVVFPVLDRFTFDDTESKIQILCMLPAYTRLDHGPRLLTKAPWTTCFAVSCQTVHGQFFHVLK